MKLLYFIFVSSVLVISEGQDYWTTPWTTAYPVGPGVNLRGKMVTFNQNSGVTFYPSYYQSPPEEGASTAPTTYTTNWPYWTSPYYTSSPPPSTRGVSVCLRFVTDSSSVTLFKLTPRRPLTFSWSNPWYSLVQNYYTQVSVNPRISLWSTVRSQPWTSVCLVLDSVKNVVQVFQGGSMSIRRILPSRIVWSGEPVLDIPGFDGQVTDLEVWDYPLEYREVYGYMLNYGPSGTVLSWSNIAYRYRGSVLIEETYAQRLSRQPISSSGSEGEDQPIRGEQGRDKRLRFRKKLCGKKERKRQTL